MIRHRHRRRNAIRTMNNGVTTQAAGGIQVPVPVTGHRDNANIEQPKTAQTSLRQPKATLA